MYNGYYYYNQRQPRNHRTEPSGDYSINNNSSPPRRRQRAPSPPPPTRHHQRTTPQRRHSSYHRTNPNTQPHVHFMANDSEQTTAMAREIRDLRDQIRRLTNDYQTLNQTLTGVIAERNDLQHQLRRHRRSSSTSTTPSIVRELEATILQQSELLEVEKSTVTRLRRERDHSRAEKQNAVIARDREKNEKLRLANEVARLREQRNGNAGNVQGLRDEVVVLTQERDVARRNARERRGRIEFLEGVVARMERRVFELEGRLRLYER